MSDENIIESTDDLRVSIDYDHFQEEPWDGTGPPVMRMDTGRYGMHVSHIDQSDRPHDMDSYVEAAIERWGTPSSDEWHLVEKYLRAFHGVTKIDWYRSDDYWYVAYDSKQWRDYTGIPDITADEYRNWNMLTQWEAWATGEVYSFAIERRVHVYQDQRRHSQVAPHFETKSSEFDTWEYVDGCGGFYGYDAAKEEALERFEAAKEDA